MKLYAHRDTLTQSWVLSITHVFAQNINACSNISRYQCRRSVCISFSNLLSVTGGNLRQPLVFNSNRRSHWVSKLNSYGDKCYLDVSGHSGLQWVKLAVDIMLGLLIICSFFKYLTTLLLRIRYIKYCLYLYCRIVVQQFITEISVKMIT